MITCALALVIAAALASSAPAATSTTTIGATVPSSTSLDLAGCAPGTPATSLGSIAPGTGVVGSATCDVEFGSTNDTSMLRISQTDARGAAMFRLTDGSVDLGFSGDGIASTGTLTAIGAVAVDSSNRVYVAGTRNANIAVARYTSAGALDGTWGSGGVAEVGMPFAGPTNCYDYSRGMAIDSSGRVVVVGYSADSPNPGNCAADPGVLGSWATVARFTSAGLPDTTFSGDGITGTLGTIRSAWNTFGTSWADVAFAPDGTILVAGSRRIDVFSGDSGFIGRYSATTGAQLGTVTINQWSANQWDDWYSTITVQDDGKVVAGGSYYRNDNFSTYATLYRADSTTLAADATFGASGQQVAGTNVGGIVDVTQLPSGSLFALTNQRRLLQRLPGGGPDNSFDGDGVQTVVGSGWTHEFVRQVDGAILLTSETTASGGDHDWELIRYLPNGQPDTTFSGDGAHTYEPTVNTDALAGIALGHDGVVYAAGQHDTSGGILKLRSATALDHAGPAVDWDAGASMFGACLEGVTDGTPTWGSTGSCTAVDTDPWNPVPSNAASAGAKVASATTGIDDAVASIRFGMRAGPSLAAGAYIAPITFTTVAPDV